MNKILAMKSCTCRSEVPTDLPVFSWESVEQADSHNETGGSPKLQKFYSIYTNSYTLLYVTMQQGYI